MEEKETRAFIVLSDTHLGLHEWKRLHFFKNTVAHRPTHVDQFVKWLEIIQTKGKIDLPVVTELLHDDGEYEIKGLSCKELLFPDKLILNGDIFELWDASDQSIQFASHSILSSISRLKSEKIYLIGNHDFANAGFAQEKTFSNIYPWGLSNIKFIRDTHLLKVKKDRDGEDYYLILHGHQFSKSFSFGSWKIFSFLRDGAEAFRLYSWVLVALLGIWISVFFFIGYLSPSISSSILYGIVMSLVFLAIPRLIASIARPMWNTLFGSRYNRKKVLQEFVPWWKKFRVQEKRKLPEEKIHVIYGHTHAIDLVDKNELMTMVKKSIEGQDLILINHPSWVKDTKKKPDTEIRAVFVYVDKYGFEFFGWNWNMNLPFHIPKSVVSTYVSGEKIDDKTADLLITLNWPKALINELRKSSSKFPRI